MQPACDYLTLEPGQPQARCGEPAVWSRRTPNGGVFYYCQTHADHATSDLKRRGKTLALDRILDEHKLPLTGR